MQGSGVRGQGSGTKNPQPETAFIRVHLRFRVLAGMAVVVALLSAPALAVRIEDITRLKGDRENKLIGLGLVVGLPGTGDGDDFLPAIRSLHQLLWRLGYEARSIRELEDAENVAVVSVSATLPPFAREGDKIDVHVNAVGAAASIKGGRLLVTPLQGPRENSAVYALAEGPVSIPRGAVATSGQIVGGAILEEGFKTEFVKDGGITLLLDRDNANFTTAGEIADVINEEIEAPDARPVAVALDKAAVKVAIPPRYRRPETLVPFISRIQQLHIIVANTEARVVINEKEGTVVITGDVEISPVIVTHKNLVVTAGEAPLSAALVPVTSDRTDRARLRTLVDLFTQLKADPHDLIAVIKELKKAGKLHAKLIIE